VSDVLRDAIAAAERHAAGQADLDSSSIDQLLSDPRRLQEGRDEERAYLALLLDFAGLRDEAILVLRDGPDPDGVNPALRNIEGMLAAVHGEYGQAKNILEEALAAAADAPPLRNAILANLSAVSFQAGKVGEAKAWAAASDSPAAFRGSPAAATLIASVQAAVASAENDRRALDAAGARLEDAFRSLASDPGDQDVAGLALVAEMAITDSQLASGEGSVSRLERAAAVLEIAALRLAAELGAGHPQALMASARLAQIGVDIALAHDSPAELEQAVAQLAAVCKRADSRLGATSPLARRLADTLTSARLVLSRARRTVTAGPGPGQPVPRAELGRLALLDEDAFGRTFRVHEFRLPSDPATLIYKELTLDRVARVRSAREAVAFRAALSQDERAELDRYTAWPRAVVADASGVECGFLMHIPEEFFSLQEDPDSGQLSARPREMTKLIAPAEQRIAEWDDTREPDLTDRMFLLAQLVYAIGWLHKRGWVFGDLSLSTVLYTLDPPRLMLLDCDGAAAVVDPARRQFSTPFWDPPECRPQGTQRLQDTATDVYKLGLAILRCLTPGKGAASARGASRLAAALDKEGVDLIGRALSADPDERPTAKDMYRYLCRVLSPRTSVPEVTAAKLTTRWAVRGQDTRIEWRISNADTVTISAGGSQVLRVELASHPEGCVFRAEESGPISIAARNRFGTVTMDVGELTLYELPPFKVDFTHLPRPQIPALGALRSETAVRVAAPASGRREISI
jgi:hypothetical protein